MMSGMPAAAPVRPEGKQAVVLYDGDCRLCQKSVALLQALDWLHCLRYVNVRDPAARQTVALPVPLERLLEEMHVLAPDGQSYSHGFRAFRWLAWRLPLLWFLLPFLYLPGAAWLGQRFYLWVARRRFRLLPCHGGVCHLSKPKD